MNYDYSNNFPPQQNWNQPPLPPKKSSSWGKWIIIALLVGGFVSTLIFLVASAGRKFGNTIGDVSKSTIGMADSIQDASVKQDYDSIYAYIDRDSSAEEYRGVIDDLRNSTDSVIALLNENQKGFNDTLKDVSSIAMFDRSWAQNYFIKTGRAAKMKRVLLVYRENTIYFLPPAEQDSSLRNYLMIDEIAKTMPGFLKKLSSWENIYFNQPVLNVNLNFKTIKMQVRNFEKEILYRYSTILK